MVCKVWLQFSMSHWSMSISQRSVWFWLENVKETLFTRAVSKLEKKFVHGENVRWYVRFFRKMAKKGKKGKIFENLEKNVKKIENISKKRQAHVCDYHMHETARRCPEIPTLYAQNAKRIKGIIRELQKTVYINVYLHVNLTLLKVKTENKYN